MIKDEWMSHFYEMDWYKIKKIGDLEKIDGKCMIEFLIEAHEYEKIELAQKYGFRMVETAVEFETLITNFGQINSNIRRATSNDLDEILEITEECYMKHDKFFNRFKNRDFFTSTQARNYYMSSVKNNLTSTDTVTTLAEDSKGICAYYMIREVNSANNYKRYKGVIAGVLQRAKGQNLHVEMQKKAFQIIGVPFYVINRTQLGNYRVLNNHFSQGRSLSKIEHIFYLKKGI